MRARPADRRFAPSFGRRAAAAAATALVVAVIGITVWRIADDLRRLLVQVPLSIVAVGAAWYWLTRTGVRRSIGITVFAAAVVAFLFVAVVEGPVAFGLAVARLAMVVAAWALGRYALGSAPATPLAGTAVPPAEEPVLIVNPRSGGGKADRVGLAAACEARGIRVVTLEPGSDLRSLVEAAVDGGADAIGMAGGDGSQAIVAAVAALRDLPMVVVPAGTRNHFALDLGLDRRDVLGALDAFGDALERRIDLAEVNGRVFVNNVSLGLYAEIIRSPAYRDAKVETALSALPSMLGPGTEPFALSFTDAVGRRHERAHVIQVSNDPYGDTVDGRTTRPRLDAGVLGVTSVEVRGDRAARSLIAAAAAGHPERFEGYASWVAPTFEVDAPAPVAAGLDGESVTLDVPLVVTTRPRALRIRLPRHAIGASPAGRSLSPRDAMLGVCRVAIGRPVRPVEVRNT
jgi:diacylglycerol kinase family enzyme